MGWTRYIIFPSVKIAIEVGKSDNSEIQDDNWDDFNEFVEYMNEENPESSVIKYLWKKCFIFDTLPLVFSILREYISDKRAEVVSEEDLPEDYTVLSRQYE